MVCRWNKFILSYLIITGKRKSKGVDSVTDMSYQKQRAYDDSRSPDRDPRSSSRYGKEPAGGQHYIKKGKQKGNGGIVITSIHLCHFVISYNNDRGFCEHLPFIFKCCQNH